MMAECKCMPGASENRVDGGRCFINVKREYTSVARDQNKGLELTRNLCENDNVNARLTESLALLALVSYSPWQCYSVQCSVVWSSDVLEPGSEP